MKARIEWSEGERRGRYRARTRHRAVLEMEEARELVKRLKADPRVCIHVFQPVLFDIKGLLSNDEVDDE